MDTTTTHTQKIAAMLLEKAKESGSPTSRVVAVQLDVTKQDVASHLGLSRYRGDPRSQ